MGDGLIVIGDNDEIMEVNILAFIATALFILVPTAFLLIIYVKLLVKVINLNET